MTTRQALTRIETITTLAGCGAIDAEKVLQVMIMRGTWTEDHDRVNLKDMWEAVDAVRRDKNVGVSRG